MVDRLSVSYGSSFLIILKNGWTYKDIDWGRVGLIRHYSVTHAFGYDQRYVAAVIQYESNVMLRVIIPGRPAGNNIYPPGDYMIFLVSQSGCPSIARMIHIE